MARPHIEFLHAQQLPWETGKYTSLGDARIKILSEDNETGACTLIVRYPPGWRGTETCYLLSDSEFYVLDGAMTINGQDFTLDCYAYFPGGFIWNSAATDNGVDLLFYLEGPPDFIHGRPASGQFDVSNAVPFLNTHDIPFTQDGVDPDYEWFGMSKKVLRHDPRTQAGTFMVEMPPQRHRPDWTGPTELHECVEELFLLSGDLHCPYGIFHAGMYLYRPPNIRHGPFYTRFGSVMLGRVDGLMENNFSESKVDMPLYTSHKPVLPKRLSALAGAAYKPKLY